MQSKFFNYTKINENSAVQQRRNSICTLNPLGISGVRTPRKSVRATSVNIEQMLSAAVQNNESDVIPEQFEDDGQPDYTAEGHDELDAMMDDFSSDDDTSEKNQRKVK